MGIINKNFNRQINAALFDMDGVLVDSISLHIDAWNQVLMKKGLPAMTNVQYFKVLGRTNSEMLGAYCNQNGIVLSVSEMDQILILKEADFRESMLLRAEATPGVKTWLDYFSQHDILCAVASSGSMANITLILTKLEIADHFSSIVSGRKFPASKPDPQIFLMAAASLGLPAKECLVIEDAPAGIQAAKAANMLCCAIATSYPKEDLAGADIILESLAEISPHELFVNHERKK